MLVLLEQNLGTHIFVSFDADPPAIFCVRS
jgi:hypothetical protein